MSNPRPCSAAEAVSRALGLCASYGNKHTGYYLGTGDYHPASGIDVPWTQATDRNGLIHVGSDCAGFALSWCYRLPRHRPGYNKGSWSTVEDDINSNSAIEDARHARDLFTLVAVDDVPLLGDLIAYPTFVIADAHGERHTFIGHVAIVVGVNRWNQSDPCYAQLDIIQVCGPNGRTPAAIATDGSVFDRHTAIWPKPEHRSVMLRATP